MCVFALWLGFGYHVEGEDWNGENIPDSRSTIGDSEGVTDRWVWNRNDRWSWMMADG
jgi:hypothetical protein